MKTYFKITLALTLFALATQAQTTFKAVVPATRILKNSNTVLEYYSDHLKFNGDLTAFDVYGQVITKGKFLKQLATGNYLPLRIYSGSQTWTYKLVRLKSDVNSDAQQMLRQIGLVSYGIYQTLGKPIPDFNFVDLDGRRYTSENTRGKIVVMKAWFISCVPCVREMPELNQLVDRYKNRKDILFISIAWDPAEKLRAFSKRTIFNYKIAPTSIDYIQTTLHVTGYPAHWVIGKNGLVVSMSYDRNDMVAALNKEAMN